MPQPGARPHTYWIVKWLAAPTVEEWEQRDDWRAAGLLTLVNMLAFVAAELFGLEDLLGVCLALSLLLLAGGYIMWERRHKRTAVALITGTLPFWLMLMFVL
jgi:hypothetical protein